MAKEFLLPEVSEGVTSVDVAAIHVNEGDIIKERQIVAEVETDKAVAEIESPYSGKVTKIHVSAGQSIDIGALILTIEEGAESSSSTGNDQPESQPGSTEKTAATKETSVPVQKQTAPPPTKTEPAKTPATPAGSPSNGEKAHIAAGPATRRMARKLGVDLSLVSGTGPRGRISQEDVEAYVKQMLSGAVTPSGSGPIVAPPLPDFSELGETERVNLNKVGKTAATNLALSWNVIPHVTQNDLSDITDIEAARRHFLQGRGKDGPKVTMTAIAIKAAVTALKVFPKFNSSLDPQTMEIVIKKFYNIGVAVDTPNGLLVPVLRNVDKKTIVEIAAEVTDLAIKARDRKLKMEEMTGATFTITNLGGIGGTGFTPIVNYPEVAILGMSRGRKELVLDEGNTKERLMLPLSLSYDHRVINGADAARFITKLSDLLSDPFTLLAEC